MMRRSIFVAAMLLVTCLPIMMASDTTEAAIGPIGYSVNGNQELLADPNGPFVYSADTDGDLVHILNATTGTEWWNISVGTAPMSMDLSADGRYLYVAVSGDSEIAVIDLLTKTISKTIPLTFQPLSIRIGQSGRLYLTDIPPEYQSGGPKVIQEATGNLIENISAYGNCVLEMSPDKSTLLLLQLGTSPTPLVKYSCAGPSLVLLDQDNGDLGGNTRQMAVDWQNETIYLVSGGPYGIECISLATMDKTGFLQTDAHPAGVALSPDGRTVFSTNMGGREYLWAFYTSNWTPEARYKLGEDSISIDPSTHAPIAYAANAGSMIALGKPVQFINLSRPALSPESPRDGEGMGYDFSSDIVAAMFVGVPPRDIISGVVSLDGVDLPTVMMDQTMIGDLSVTIQDGGWHTATAELVYVGGSATLTWNFKVSEVEHLISVFPEENEELDYLPAHLSIAMDLGFPQRSVTSTQVKLNNHYPSSNIALPASNESDAYWIIDAEAEGRSLILPGVNIVEATITFVHTDYMQPIYTQLSMMWAFSVQNITFEPSYEGLEWRNKTGQPALMAPPTWPVTYNTTVGGALFEMRMTGPTYGTVLSQITVQHGLDPAVEESMEYLGNLVDMLVQGLALAGFNVTVADGPSYTTIWGHVAVEFGVRYLGIQLAQRFAVVVDESSGEYWIFIMSVEESHYYEKSPMFEAIVRSYGASDSEEDITEALSDAIMAGLVVVACIALAVLGAVVFIAVRDLVNKRPRH